MKFYDLSIKNSDSIEEIIRLTKKLGWSGIGIYDTIENIDKLNNTIKNLKVEDFEIYAAVKIKADTPTELNRRINEIRNKVMIVIVHGGDYNINRAACENPLVDILAHPEMGRFDNGLDEYCLNKAKENKVAIQINFANILNKYRKSRSYELVKISENIRLSSELGIPIIINSDAHNKWELRSPRDLIAVVNILGLELSNTFQSLSNIPLNIIEKNKKRLEGKIVGKGVEIE